MQNFDVLLAVILNKLLKIDLSVIWDALTLMRRNWKQYSIHVQLQIWLINFTLLNLIIFWHDNNAALCHNLKVKNKPVYIAGLVCI